MDEEDWAIAVDLGLVSRFDFFWDDFADRVGYHAPGSPKTGRSATSTQISTRGDRLRD